MRLMGRFFSSQSTSTSKLASGGMPQGTTLHETSTRGVTSRATENFGSLAGHAVHFVCLPTGERLISFWHNASLLSTCPGFLSIVLEYDVHTITLAQYTLSLYSSAQVANLPYAMSMSSVLPTALSPGYDSKLEGIPPWTRRFITRILMVM